MFWAGLLIGLLAGAGVGVFLSALAVAAGREPPRY